MSDNWGIHWFRRDLRIEGNAALRRNWKLTNGKTVGVFCFDSKFLVRNDFSHNRFAFFLKSLRTLRKEFAEIGGDLIVVDQQPVDFIGSLLDSLKKSKKVYPSYISWNNDYEPFAVQRDKKVKELVFQKGIGIITERDHLIFEPEELLRNESIDSFYRIYSPFSKKWYQLLNSELGRDRILKSTIDKSTSKSHANKVFRCAWKNVLPNRFILNDMLDEFETKNNRFTTVYIPEAGREEVSKLIKKFKLKIDKYINDRDFPITKGTSRFSMFLKNGSITSSRIVKEFDLLNLTWTSQSGSNQFLKEIVWREFYYHILYYRPDVEKSEFNSKYQNLPWQNNFNFFERWKEGSTGFPIVDAGMRELRQTGWMHNRVRMIVASFLTKDLLVDWRFGENYFMKELLDGDIAPNNGGWQWAASTGCDPQPYFRVFNPWLQSAKFDPRGLYIKKFVPELSGLPPGALHSPEADRKINGYPDPIVDHNAQREKALLMYKGKVKN